MLTRVCSIASVYWTVNGMNVLNNFFKYSSHMGRKVFGVVPSGVKMSFSDAKRQKIDDNVSDRLVWVDLEMTGLDVTKEHIIEMACLVTDADLNVVAEAEDLIIHQPDSVLDNMGQWCKEQHGKSGLTEAVRKSQLSLKEAESQMVEFVQQHTVKGRSPLAGNSIHADKAFIAKYMPQFMEQLHYRIIDVSSIKELTRRWYPQEYQQAPLKKGSHRALDDIKESIEELKYYKRAVFKQEAT